MGPVGVTSRSMSGLEGQCRRGEPVPGLQIKFDIRMIDYEWKRDGTVEIMQYGHEDGRDSDKPCDCLPFLHKVVCWVQSNDLSYEMQNYTLNSGCSFTYNVTQTPRKTPSNGKVQQATPYVDTLKVACFTLRGDMTKGPHEAAGEMMDMSRNNQDSYSLLCAKFFTIDDLLTKATGENGHIFTMKHNFSNNALRVCIKNVSVCFAGTTYDNAEKYTLALKTASDGMGRTVDSFVDLCDSPMMQRSMMHSMEHRNKQIQAIAGSVGRSVEKCCTIRSNSIGSMMQQAYTCGMIEGELKLISDVGRFFKSDTGSYESDTGYAGPEWAAHNFAHACAVTGTQPHTPSQSVVSSGNYEPVRELSCSQMVTLLHTTQCIPFFSSDMTPYISDGVCMPTLQQINEMTQNPTLTWPETGFELTECIDNAMSVPNDYNCRGADCEGGTALHCMTYRNICGLMRVAQEKLRDLSTLENRNALSRWVIEDCHTSIPQNQHYAFAVQLVVVGAVAQYAAEVKALTVGAKSAAFDATVQEKAMAMEGGHSCAVLEVNEKHVGEIMKNVYAVYTGNRDLKKSRQANQFNLLSKQQTSTVRMEDVYPESTSHCLASKTMATQDILQTKCFYILESTTAISRHPMTGVVSADMRVRGPGAASMKHIQVPFASYLQQMEMSLLNDYVSDAANMRVQGFNMQDVDSKCAVAFYGTFYQMDECMLNEFQGNTYYSGATANNFLYHKDAHMTIEDIPMPMFSPEQRDKFQNDMREQWKETRLPTVGPQAVKDMMKSWYRAPAVPVHCPENIDVMLYRCNVTLSGADGHKFMEKHLVETLCKTSHLVSSDDGLFADVHVFKMGVNTVVLSQALRVNKLRDRCQSM